MCFYQRSACFSFSLPPKPFHSGPPDLKTSESSPASSLFRFSFLYNVKYHVAFSRQFCSPHWTVTRRRAGILLLLSFCCARHKPYGFHMLGKEFFPLINPFTLYPLTGSGPVLPGTQGFIHARQAFYHWVTSPTQILIFFLNSMFNPSEY